MTDLNEIIRHIRQTNWQDYETAYGRADEKGVAKDLEKLLSDNEAEALSACHALWCSLCHQHAFISSAALPAYDVLMYGLEKQSNAVKIEILDIFLGFAKCSSDSPPVQTIKWQPYLRQKLQADTEIFISLCCSPNPEIKYFAEAVCEELGANPSLTR